MIVGAEFSIPNFKFVLRKGSEFFAIDKFCENKKPRRIFFVHIIYLLFSPNLGYCLALPG